MQCLRHGSWVRMQYDRQRMVFGTDTIFYFKDSVYYVRYQHKGLLTDDMQGVDSSGVSYAKYEITKSRRTTSAIPKSKTGFYLKINDTLVGIDYIDRKRLELRYRKGSIAYDKEP